MIWYDFFTLYTWIIWCLYRWFNMNLFEFICFLYDLYDVMWFYMFFLIIDSDIFRSTLVTSPESREIEHPKGEELQRRTINTEFHGDLTWTQPSHTKKKEAVTPSYKSVLQPLTIVYYSYHMLSSKLAPVILLTKLSKVWGTTLTIDSDPSSAFPWPEMSNLRPTTMKQPNICIYIYIYIIYFSLKTGFQTIYIHQW